MGPCGKRLGPLLAALLCELLPLQRSVLRLTVLEGVSMRKAADWLGVAPATVQRARRQTLAMLRTSLKAQSHQSDSAP
jgi:DNA-directed RNA polymerase specialized sigma24 family protein